MLIAVILKTVLNDKKETRGPNLAQDEVEVAANGLKKSSQKLLDKFIKFENALCSFFLSRVLQKGKNVVSLCMRILFLQMNLTG